MLGGNVCFCPLQARQKRGNAAPRARQLCTLRRHKQARQGGQVPVLLRAGHGRWLQGGARTRGIPLSPAVPSVTSHGDREVHPGGSIYIMELGRAGC